MLRRMRRLCLLLACLALVPATRALAGADAAFVDLTGATVIASPGTPEGLHAFLPGGVAPRPLTWPLPDGPVLVLGLPRSDAAARDLALFWDLLAPGEDLHGGYLVAAWHDGTRPIGVILADDAAALQAARFELDAMPAPGGMESLDFTKPPAEAGIRLPRGLRGFRPRFAIRAYFPRRASPESVLTAIAGHANRFWIHVGRGPSLFDPLPQLVRHGVEPCVHLHVPVGHETVVEQRVAPWVLRGVRHVVLAPGSLDAGAADVRRHVEHLRSRFDLDEVVIGGHLLRIPGAMGTWPTEPALGSGLPLDEARQIVATAGVPLLFVDSWARASSTPVPSRRRGLLPGLGRLFRGVVVPDGPGDGDVLADAWAPSPEAADEWETVLLPLLPRGALGPRAFLEQSAARLAAPDAPTRRAVGWWNPLLGRIRSSLGELAERAVLVPRVPAPVNVDGELSEPLWGHAVALDFPLPGGATSRSGTLLAVSDGRDLYLALRLPADAEPLALVVSPSARGPEPGAGIGDAARSDTGVMRRTDTTRTWEGVLGHFELAGDAHPTRVLHLWHRPTVGAPQRLGSLVLGP